MEEKHRAVVSSCPVVYNLSLNMTRDIMKQNKCWKDVAEISAGSGACL